MTKSIHRFFLAEVNTTNPTVTKIPMIQMVPKKFQPERSISDLNALFSRIFSICPLDCSSICGVWKALLTASQNANHCKLRGKRAIYA